MNERLFASPGPCGSELASWPSIGRRWCWSWLPAAMGEGRAEKKEGNKERTKGKETPPICVCGLSSFRSTVHLRARFVLTLHALALSSHLDSIQDTHMDSHARTPAAPWSALNQEETGRATERNNEYVRMLPGSWTESSFFFFFFFVSLPPLLQWRFIHSADERPYLYCTYRLKEEYRTMQLYLHGLHNQFLENNKLSKLEAQAGGAAIALTQQQSDQLYYQVRTKRISITWEQNCSIEGCFLAAEA